MYLGVHWVTDVIVGWLIGPAWVVAIALLAARARPPREQQSRFLAADHY